MTPLGSRECECFQVPGVQLNVSCKLRARSRVRRVVERVPRVRITGLDFRGETCVGAPVNLYDAAPTVDHLGGGRVSAEGHIDVTLS